MTTKISYWLVKHSLLILICMLAFMARLYRVDFPLLDWNSWRQVDTVSVSYRYAQEGIQLLYPKYHDVSNISSGLNNLEGYKMAEFPIINALIASIVIIIPSADIVVVSRLLSILFSVGTIICLYYLANHISGKKVAFWTTLIYALMPYAIYYGRSTLLDPALVFFCCLGILGWYYWLEYNQAKWFSIGVVAIMLAFLLSSFALFIFPVIISLSCAKYSKQVWRYYSLYLFLVLSILPLFWWKAWISQFPGGIPITSWLFNGSDAVNDPFLQKLIGYNSDGSRYQLFWFHWIIFERIIKLFLGFAAIAFIPFAWIRTTSKEAWLLMGWWGGMIGYILIVAQGNLEHDYYQQLLIPIIAYTLGRGIVLFDQYFSKMISKVFAGIAIAILLIISWSISWYQVKDYFQVHNLEYQKAGLAVQRLTNPDDLIIAVDPSGDNSFLFQTKRNGWSVGLNVEDKMKLGAKYFVSTKIDDSVVKYLSDKYFTVEKTDDFIIIDLTKQKIE